MKRLSFPSVIPTQSTSAQVACFVATASQIATFARIDRAGRNEDGLLSGFQRPQIATHIREIGDYLERSDAMLANPIIVGFVSHAKIARNKDGTGTLQVDLSAGAPGWIVDGQQRYSALMESSRGDFEVPVSAFICDSEEELRRQFILVNSTKPLSKGLIYELLPDINGLPKRYASRSEASAIAQKLNFKRGSSLAGMIKMGTNPDGIIQDTVIQKMLMTSLTDGALRLYRGDQKLLLTKGVDLISEFFHAVKFVYADAWTNHTPKTSRLIHGTGITALGYAMEYIHAATGATTRDEFIETLKAIRPACAWTDGEWTFGTEKRRWNSLQNLSADTKLLSFHIVHEIKKALAARAKGKGRVRR
ncbi:DGQHR domain-containing protein [Luteibacter sp. HA06]